MHKPEPQTAGTAEAPLYIRWGADRSPFAIELRLDLVQQIREALGNAENSGIEIGGVLVGSLPTEYSSTVRVEDIEMIARSPQDGATFMLDPGQHDRFAEVRWRSRTRDKTAVGMFRSHLRPGKLRPSLADRTLLSSEFQGPVYALLLVQSQVPNQAAFFVAAHGQLPVEPSVREFKWDESDFRALPEIDPEPATAATLAAEASKSRPRRWRAGVIAAICLIAGAASAFFFLGNGVADHVGFASLFGSKQGLRLEARPANSQLRISWNHFSQELDNASGATVRIRAGNKTREVKIGPDELRLGSLILENTDSAVEVTLALQAPGSSPISQTVFWQNR
jgi:hypothetical protein